MPPYFALEMGLADMNHSQMAEPIRGPADVALVVAFQVLNHETFVEMNDHDPCDEEDDGAPTASSCCSESVSSSTTSSSKKRVSFAALHIRNHSVILGDHPCCTVGLPITLDWTVESEISVDLEAYEATRERRRSRPEMILSVDDRHALLSEDMASGDLRRVQRKLHKERRCVTGRAKNMFFSPLGNEQQPQAATTTATVGSSE